MQNRWLFIFFLLLTIIKKHVVNSQTFLRSRWLTMNGRLNLIGLNNMNFFSFHKVVGHFRSLKVLIILGCCIINDKACTLCLIPTVQQLQISELFVWHQKHFFLVGLIFFADQKLYLCLDKTMQLYITYPSSSQVHQT